MELVKCWPRVALLSLRNSYNICDNRQTLEIRSTVFKVFTSTVFKVFTSTVFKVFTYIVYNSRIKQLCEPKNRDHIRLSFSKIITLWQFLYFKIAKCCSITQLNKNLTTRRSNDPDVNSEIVKTIKIWKYDLQKWWQMLNCNVAQILLSSFVNVHIFANVFGFDSIVLELQQNREIRKAWP